MLETEQNTNFMQPLLAIQATRPPPVEIEIDLGEEKPMTKEDWKKLPPDEKLDVLYDLLGEINATANQALNSISGLSQGINMLAHRVGKIEKCLKDKEIME